MDITAWRIATEPGVDVLDYRRLYAIVAGHVDTNAVGYLEGPAHAIVKAVLAEPGVVRARVVLRKPQVALPGPLDAAEVAVERTRDA